MKRTISSGGTYFIKFIVPKLYIGIFGLLTLLVLIVEGKVAWIFLVALVACFVVHYLYGRPLSQVQIDEHFILISDFRRVIQVPLSEIRDVKEKWWFNPVCIAIELKHSTPLGQKVTFVPEPFFKPSPFSLHPIVGELRSLAGLN